MAVKVRVLDAVRDVPREAWDALHTDRDSPFVEWEWLDALESTGCAAPDKGWTPRHITIWRDGQMVAAAPAYVKRNSEGEFVFDWSWADAARRAGIGYYPKLILAVPFTPATGARLLRAPGEDLDEVAGWLSEAARAEVTRHRVSSAHVLFPHREEAEALERRGFATRLGVQFHWHNEGYRQPEDFLARFQSKQRNNLKRERSQVARDGMTVETLRGDAITPAIVEPMYRFYAATVDKFFYGRRYLSPAFFARVAETFRHRLEWVIAREKTGEIVAGAFNVARGPVLYGRYWGADVERPFLHFNVCYYHSIDACIARGLETFEPGAGGEHKLVRGFDPTITYSSHHMEHPALDRAVRDFLAREAEAVQQGVETERAQSPLRRKG